MKPILPRFATWVAELNPWKKILLGVGIALVVFVLTNFSYLWKNAQFSIQKPSPQNTSDQTSNVTAEPDMLWVDSLNIKAPVKYITEANEKAYQAALKDGVVHFPGTALPGQLGNVYIFGHSSDYAWSGGHYKTVFALLPRIPNDAEIRITDTSGTLYRYKVFSQRVVAADDTSVLDQKGNQEKLLTLQTSYPVGTALKRYVVIARLVE